MFQSSPTPQDCARIEPASCPACPAAEPVVQQCADPQVVERVITITPPPPVAPPPPKPTTAGKMNLQIVGAVEWATIEPGNIRMEARIDTGTESTTIHAEDIQLVEKDGKRWVHFSLLDPETGEPVAVEQRLRKKIKVRQGENDKQTRYVVELWITVGKIHSLVDVTLSDSDHMEYPLHIGRNMLVDTMIVDVSDRHTSK